MGNEAKQDVSNVNTEPTWGVLLARFQPVHNGHLELLKQALKENDKVLVLIGSAKTLNKRNPIPIEERQMLVESAIAEKFTEEQQKNIVVMQLEDLSTEKDNTYEWGYYLHINIAEVTGSVYFTQYYSDGMEIVMQWFPPFARNNYISFKLNARGRIFNNLSATAVRKMIVEDKKQELSKLVPSCVIENMTILKHHILASKRNSDDHDEE